MELDALKNSWNTLDQRLSETEIVNQRLVRQVVEGNTRTAYDQVCQTNLNSLIQTAVMACVVFPVICVLTHLSVVTIVIVEALLVAGLIPQIWKLFLLSKFDLGRKSCSELRGLLLRYEKVYHNQSVIEIIVVSLALIAGYIYELGFKKSAGYVMTDGWLPVMIGLIVLTIALAFVLTRWQRRRHAQQLQDIEQGLKELQAFNVE